MTQVFSASGASGQLTVITWILSAHHSALVVAWAGALIFLPTLFVAPWVATICHRLSRRAILLGTQFGLALVPLALAWGLRHHGDVETWCLSACSLTGLINSLDGTARQLMVVDIVGEERIAQAVGLYEVALNASRVIGPATAGFATGFMGETSALALVAACYLPSLAYLCLRPSQRSTATAYNSDRQRLPQGNSSSAGETNFLGRSRSILLGRDDLRRCLLLGAAVGLTFSVSTTLPPLLRREFHTGAHEYGIVLACFGVGSLAGSLRMAVWPRHPEPRVISHAVWGTAISVVAVGWSPNVFTLAAMLIPCGWFAVTLVSLANAYVQIQVTSGQRPTMLALWGAFIPGLNPATGLCAGALATLVSPRLGESLSAALLLGALLVTRRKESRS